ncbi:FKBP-type peptidyl-prolyl cis-trans isomerase [Mucilaginibacter psychrotolerans]|uniref:Peptidyl-prolyl cis-trans isomerase n=1 Tax=Mucilaginibacter psychrotolerans TaxID=1524096 RepID=A0A4Y8S524_9SPHI|nr:FKBP-type peptidyl-prolyl cis-trans isomerase [Mucilaginibacter psychrotolerans]TFF34048.1 peptidylprolyl isomerase [Mucilaginibacter psychrotolerans]
MKKYILILSLLVVGFSACKKEAKFDAAAQAVADDNAIKAYLAANTSITATKDASGIYYQIITPGSGTNPTVSSNVTVNYVGKLLDGSQFDKGTAVSFPLANVIQGWQKGIPFLKPGGRMVLIIPSALAYGNSSPGAGIPANSVLVFTVDLLSVTN